MSKEELEERIDNLNKQIEENRSILKEFKKREMELELLTGILIANKQLAEKELYNL